MKQFTFTTKSKNKIIIMKFKNRMKNVLEKFECVSTTDFENSILKFSFTCEDLVVEKIIKIEI